MYRAVILAAFITSFANAAYRISDGKEFGSSGFNFTVVADTELRRVVEGAVAKIDHIARSTWTAEQKLTGIRAEMLKVQEFRKTAWSRSPATEHKLDLLINPYESYPQPAEFRKGNCSQYFSTLKIDWEPTAMGAPTLKGVKRAWDNLRAICQ